MAAKTRSSEAGAEPREAAAETARRIRDYGREARQEGEAFLQATRGVVGEVENAVREQLERRPLATLGAAFGFGLFLGGGLPFGVVRFASRAAAGMLVNQLLASAVPGVTSSSRSSSP
jgi:hypothetical protein